MLPGGKPELGESFEEAVVREAREELGAELDSSALRKLGSFKTDAANEPNFEVAATVFEHPFVEVGAPAAEIEAMRWMDLDDDSPLPGDLAPLLTNAVLPVLNSRKLRQITIFTGARPGNDPRFDAQAAKLASYLGSEGIGVVFGGGKAGLMGTIADCALGEGGAVTGVMPQHLVDAEIAHTGLTSLEVVGTMHERKARMVELGDAFVAMPGGAGTLDELFEAWTWLQLGIHTKPVALYDSAYWAPLLEALKHMMNHGFVRSADFDSLVVADDPEELISKLRDWEPPIPKWTNR